MRVRLCSIQLTEVPAVMGIWISKTMILAVKEEVKGMMAPGRQRTLPIFSDIGSTPVRVRLTFDPEPVHGRISPSLSITESHEPLVPILYDTTHSTYVSQ